MSNKVDLKKVSSYYLIGTLFNKGIVFITVPIFTRLLTVEDYGIVTTYNSWVSIISIFMSLALYMAVRASFIDYKGKEDDFLSVIVTFTLIYGFCVSMLITTTAYIVPISFNIGLLILCLLQSLANALIENVSMYFMMQYRYRARTAIMVLPNLISTITAIFLIKFVMTNRLYLGRVLPNVFVTAFFGAVCALFTLKNSKLRFNKEYLRYGLKISLPLIFHGLALSILSQSDRTMITAIRNASETGIYGLIYNFSMIATVLTTALDGVWIPFFTGKMKTESYDEINTISKKYIKLMTLVILGVVLIAPEIVKILATKPYWEGISVIPPIVLANYLIFLYTMYVNIEHYHKKTVFISINTLVAAASNILLNLYFIKIFGYVGAAYTTIASYFISLILHYIYARRLNHILFPLKQILFPSICTIMGVILFYLFIEMWVIRWLIALGAVIFVFFTEKNWILSILREKK